MTDSQRLLVEYAMNGSESAFRELVSRYSNLVYSTALRLVGGVRRQRGHNSPRQRGSERGNHSHTREAYGND
jgi:hypothetical protein